MGPSPILSITHTVTIGTMPNFSGGNKAHGLKNVMCKQTFNQSISCVWRSRERYDRVAGGHVPGLPVGLPG